jgi:tripartite-type tricarboxylate transporter receptor subunit TctC
MSVTRRMVLAGLVSSPFIAASRAAGWPAGAIRIIVPFPPGGSVDAVARLLASGLAPSLGTNVYVENMPGASGSIGTAAAVRSPPDGNSWLLVFDTHAVNPSLMPDLPYDTRTDLVPVYLVGKAANLLATSPSRPFKTLSEVVEAAKKAPETITYASTGSGTLGHLTMVWLANQAQVKLVHVPYKGGGPAVADAIGGHVDLVIGSVALLTPYIQAGKLHAIVQTGAERVPALSATPTVVESGYPGFESYAWWGVYAPKGTPQPILDRFTRDLRAVLGDEKVVRQLTEAQQMTLINGGPEELTRFFEEQMRIWGKIIKDNNIKINS